MWADGAPIGTGTTDGSGRLAMPDGLSHASIVAGLGGTIISGTTSAPSGSLAVGTLYEGYPCEVFADIGGTGAPVHAGSVVVFGGAVTLPNGQQATTITACTIASARMIRCAACFGAG